MKRYLVVGGAGSLEVAPGVKLIDTPEFPAKYKTEAAKGGAFLELLRKEPELDWTYPVALGADRRPASAPANSASVTISCSSTRRAAAFRAEDYADRRSWTNSKSRPIPPALHGRLLSRR